MAISKNPIRWYVYHLDAKVNRKQVHLNMKQLAINLIFAGVVTATIFHRQIMAKGETLATEEPRSEVISDRWYDLVDN